MPFAAALDDVAIVIDDEPSPEQLRESDIAGGRGALRPL